MENVGNYNQQASTFWPTSEPNQKYSHAQLPDDERHPFLADSFDIPDDHESVRDLEIKPLVLSSENEINKRQVTVAAIILVIITMLLKSPVFFSRSK